MTNREKKMYLARYGAADKEINDLLNRRDEIKSRLERMTPTYSGMPGGGGDSDKLTNGIAKLIELEREIDRKVDDLVDFERTINSFISKIDSDKQRRLLQLRYIRGMKWDRIAVEMGYEIRQITRIHGYALLNLRLPEDVL